MSISFLIHSQEGVDSYQVNVLVLGGHTFLITKKTQGINEAL
jgi:hypothetical protein